MFFFGLPMKCLRGARGAAVSIETERWYSFMRKLLSLLMALLMLLTAIPALADETPAPEPVVITIFHTNDVHGRYNSADGMGYAMMASYVNAARKDGNVLVMDAGDTLHGTVFANAVKGESLVEVMNAIGYDVMTPQPRYNWLRPLARAFRADGLTVCANIPKDGKPPLSPR